jgi:hypothetical protein
MGKDEEAEITVGYSVLDIRFLFDVERSTFDVRCSSFKTTTYCINAICERLQNNLALMNPLPQRVNAPDPQGQTQTDQSPNHFR